MKGQRRGKQAGAGSGSAVAFAVLGVLCAAIVFTAPATASAAGSISGTVTDAASHQPIAGVRVCAFEEGPEEEIEEVCAHSEAQAGTTRSPPCRPANTRSNSSPASKG